MLPKSKDREEIQEAVVVSILSGMSIAECVKQDGWPTAEWTIYRWLAQDEDFLKAVTQAQYCRMSQEALDIFKILDDKSGDIIENTTTDEDGNVRVHKLPNIANVQRDRARAQMRQWALAKLRPQKFADKIADILPDDGKGKLIVVGFKSRNDDEAANEDG